MPVTWWISHDDRLVLASAEGDISPGSFEEYMSALVAAGAMPYRKLFDVTYATPGAIRLAQLKEFASKVVAFAKQGAVGPLAIVVGSELEQRWLNSSLGRMPGARLRSSATGQKRESGWTGWRSTSSAANGVTAGQSELCC